MSDNRSEKERGSQETDSSSEEKTKELINLNEVLEQKFKIMEKKYDDLQLNFKMKNEHFLEKEAEIMALNVEIEKLKLKEIEKTSIENGMAVVQEELFNVKIELKSKGKEIENLIEVIIVFFV